MDVLESNFTIPIRDPLWGHIYLTDELVELTNLGVFRRLSRISQLGPVVLVYPGATHTRASHSLGVYHLGRRLLKLLIERGANRWVHKTGAISFLVAALLHDLGHFPYAHALKDLLPDEHEALSAQLMLQEPLKTLISHTGADPYLTAAIVDKKRPVDTDSEVIFYRKLLSGVLDPDKMDYLNRDARYCGIPYGAQDVDFIYSRLIPHKERGVDIDSRGISSIEAVLFAKYLMYRSVYWHRDVRAATAMMKKAVKTALEAGLIQKEMLYSTDDAGLFALLKGNSHTSAVLANAVYEGLIHTTVREIPFDRVKHSSFLDFEVRTGIETAIAQALSTHSGQNVDTYEVLLDLPEPVSFETGLFVVDEIHPLAAQPPETPLLAAHPFIESPTVFSSHTLTAFTQSLRVFRVCLSKKAASLFIQSPRLQQKLEDILTSLLVS